MSENMPIIDLGLLKNDLNHSDNIPILQKKLNKSTGYLLKIDPYFDPSNYSNPNYDFLKQIEQYGFKVFELKFCLKKSQKIRFTCWSVYCDSEEQEIFLRLVVPAEAFYEFNCKIQLYK